MYFIRKVKKSKLLILTLTSVLFFISLIISTINDYNNFVKQEESSISEQSVTFEFSKNINDKDMKESLNILLSLKDVTFSIKGNQISFEPGTFTEGIYLFESPKYNLPLLEGRFFNEDDFKNDFKEVVIGKILMDLTFIEDGNRYINRGVDKYKVIGIIGENNKRSYFDFHLFYKINNLSLDEIKSSDISVTSNIINSQEIEKFLIANNKYFIDIDNHYNHTNKIETFKKTIKYSGIYLLYFTGIVLCILITFIIALISWINNIKQEIIVRKAYGATKFKLFKDIISRYLIIVLISIILSTAIQFIASISNILNINYTYSGQANFLVILSFLIFIGILFCTISLNFINKVQPSEILKEQ